MNPAQIHLLANHLPLFATGMGFLILAYGVLRGQAPFQRLAALILVAAALAMPVVYFSGEGTEDAVEAIAGVQESRIHDHEEAAEAAAAGTAALGVAAFAFLLSWAFPLAARWRARGAWLLVAGSALAFGWLGWTSHLGGLIRHAEELGAPANAAPAAAEGED